MKYTMKDGSVITEKETTLNGFPCFEYSLNGVFVFGTPERTSEHDLIKLYNTGYFGNEPKELSPKVKASMKYDKANVKQIKLSLNRKTDADIIEILEKCDNVQGYIKDLIRNDNT